MRKCANCATSTPTFTIINLKKPNTMKINIFCMNNEGRIVCGMVTHSEKIASEYVRMKNAIGLITITKRG